MQDLLLQQVALPENQHADEQDDIYNGTSNYITNQASMLQTTNTINGKSSAIVQPMPTTYAVQNENDESHQSKTQAFPDIQHMFQPIPQNMGRPVTPPAMTYLVQSYMNNPIVSSFQTPYKSDSNGQKQSPPTKGGKSSDDEFIDVVNDSLESQRQTDTSKDADSSLSSASASGSPSSGSNASSSPRSSDTSTPKSTDKGKKKARTNYSPDQVQALEKVFHEQPYPDPEMMEKLSKDLDIQEGKIKVWFQNKRARWRRRAQESVNNNAYQYPFMSPMMSPVAPYGFMAPNPMFAGNSPPAQVVPSHLMYPSTPVSYPSTPVSYPSTPGSQSPTNQQQQPQQQQQQQQMTSPFQPRPGQFPPYFYPYPYGMYPPYYRG